ncbi:UV DNA damage repair endonuclease UvsE [Gloeobacter kilaueensis]|uniref:UV DNA damage endonuclease n=1 Tax=Gloeobacter kilaueensis (strain ATCC BAA-2537 / CCAP 1431/1 / ULC 316 / JS1) TaxID=1183438 RepID=U5QHR9_GLOK1|nr:UV DNA damage repair endonuclease UvsE [Gloeobacter kilaueensis]AGY57210.1 UV DNA damage endonuclease [Gloeobacter kilaueensis JS1]
MSTSPPLPALGLVCITASDQVRFRTLTRKRLLQLGSDEQLRVLGELYQENLRRLDRAIDYCLEHGIRLYRLSSALFPFADERLGGQVLATFAEPLGQAGERASRAGLRLVVHPDQYVVLNSDDPAVIENAVKVLIHHARVLDLMGQPRSPWALIEIHGGKANRSERLIEQIALLPDSVRLRLGLENDEYAYRACEIYEICCQSGVPMVFDAHHHVIAEQLTSYDDPSVGQMLACARSTWPVPQ